MLKIKIHLVDGKVFESEITGFRVMPYGIKMSMTEDELGDSRSFFWEKVKKFEVVGVPGKKQVDASLRFQNKKGVNVSRG